MRFEAAEMLTKQKSYALIILPQINEVYGIDLASVKSWQHLVKQQISLKRMHKKHEMLPREKQNLPLK